MRFRKTALVVSAVLVTLWSFTALAQTGQPERATITELRDLRGATESAELPDELRTRIVELYDAAISALETAENNRAAAASFERNRKDVDRMVAELRTELDRPMPRAGLDLPEGFNVPQIEDALTRERSRLAANISALREQQRLADDRTKSRADTSRRLGELDHELELLNRELVAQTGSAVRIELKAAARLHTLARIEAADSEKEMLRARLALLADRSALIPLNTDLAQRRVAVSEDIVELYARKAQELRIERARTMLARVRELGERIKDELPQLTELVDQTEMLAEDLFGEGGTIASSEKVAQELASTRNHQTQLNRITDLTVRKFEAYGHRGSIQRWWPEIPADFPEISDISKTLRILDEEIPEVEHTLISIEQERSRAHEFGRTTIRNLREELGDELTPELEREIVEFLAVRQDVLDTQIERGGRYSNELVEFRTVAGNFLTRIQAVERFLYSHVLFSRSVPRPVIPRPREIGTALSWFFSTTHLDSFSLPRAKLRGNPLFTLLLLLLIVGLRRPLRGYLVTLADQTLNPEEDRLGLTMRALIVTMLLAAPIPLMLYIAGVFTDRGAGSPYWVASSRALIELAIVAALLESIRQIFAPRGLAEVHFGWPVSATRPLHRGLLVTEVVGLPLLYIALQLAFAGMRLTRAEELQVYNNSLGRVAFIVALLIFGFAILSMLRPEKKTEPADSDMLVPWPRRFSNYAFPTAFLGAYPIVILATIVPVILAAFGYYLTGLLLAYQMLRTLVLASLLLVGGGLIYRSRSIRRNRAMLEADDDIDSQPRLRELGEAERQARQLFRFAAIVILAVGLLGIWSEALPMLQLLKRVQLLPRVELLQATESATEILISTNETPTITQTSGEEPSTEQTTAIPMPGSSTGAGGTTAPEPRVPLTLWLLIEAIVAAAITISLVRNLPGVIEITLQRRTSLDAGARFAFATLVKYTAAITGSTVVFTLLGIGWAKVQWLAAALTFGLGFGLQEIVANFVSGIILLVERPVRVGDVVTIGNLMGTVSRIQIRATTISLWDRSEMIVPNKEFITTKLVNWTLSDSKRRIEIPLRIAYGADLEQVKSLLISAAEAHPLVLDDPAPQALLLTFGDDAINFELRFVVDFGNGIKAKDDVQMAIDRAFRENGIEFALPQLRLRLPDGDPGIPTVPGHQDGDEELSHE